MAGPEPYSPLTPPLLRCCAAACAACWMAEPAVPEPPKLGARRPLLKMFGVCSCAICWPVGCAGAPDCGAACGCACCCAAAGFTCGDGGGLGAPRRRSSESESSVLRSMVGVRLDLMRSLSLITFVFG